MLLTSHALLTELSPSLSPEAHSWLEQTLADRALSSDRRRLPLAFTQAPRKLASACEQPLTSALVPMPVPATLLELVRASLLLAALETLPSEEHVALVDGLFRTGGQREQQCVLRALALLPEPARFCELAIAACRTNDVGVFAAIASDNPFPAQHFPELHFNQLVLKAIFLGVPVASIEELAQRANPELRRMLDEYASERRAAGRSVPADVSRVLALCER